MSDWNYAEIREAADEHGWDVCAYLPMIDAYSLWKDGIGELMISRTASRAEMEHKFRNGPFRDGPDFNRPRVIE